jgi:hypothetical protein
MKEIPFIGPAYQGRSENYSAQRCVNWYLEAGKGKSPALLIGCPGLTSPLVTLTGGGIRGMYPIDTTNSVVVCGGNVWKVDNNFATTLLGTIANDSRPVQIVWNGTSIVVVSAGSMYSLSLSGTSSTLIRTTIGSVDYIDDRFVATEQGTDFFVWSDVVSTTFNALSIQAANGAPDKMVGVKVARRTVYLFGTKSLEQWYDSGGADNPFSRIDGGFFEIGCVAKDSIAEMDGVFWLSGDEKGAGSVWTVTGGAPRRISTPAIEFAIAQWPDMSDAEAFTYNQEGHSFYVLSSVSGNETWCYDITTNEWHQRAYLHSSGALYRIRPRCHMYFTNRNLVGDWETGAIYGYDLDTYSDNGNPLPAIRACSTLQSGLEMQPHTSFQLVMDPGVGLTGGTVAGSGFIGLLALMQAGAATVIQGQDPQAMLRWSKDGGKTWSNALWRSFGRIGEYARRCIWRRIGGGRRMVLEVTITDPVKRNVTGAYIT